MGNIRNENSYKEALINSGSYKHLSPGERARLTMFIFRLNGADLSAFPGKRETERATGLCHKEIERVDYILGKLGFLLKREQMTIKGGKVWKYYLNPEVPKITKEQAGEARKEVRDLLPPHLKNSEVRDCSGEVRDFSGQVRDFWGQSEGLNVLKSDTTILNHNNHNNLRKEKNITEEEKNKETKANVYSPRDVIPHKVTQEFLDWKLQEKTPWLEVRKILKERKKCTQGEIDKCYNYYKSKTITPP